MGSGQFTAKKHRLGVRSTKSSGYELWTAHISIRSTVDTVRPNPSSQILTKKKDVMKEIPDNVELYLFTEYGCNALVSEKLDV